MSLVKTTSPPGLATTRWLNMPLPFSSWSFVPTSRMEVVEPQDVSVLVARPFTCSTPGPSRVRISPTSREPFTTRFVFSAMSALKPGTSTRSSTAPLKFTT